MILRTFALAALLFSGTTLADNQASSPSPIVIKDVARFLDYQRDLRADVESKKFRHIREAQRRELFKAQEQIFTLLDGKRSIEELSHEQQIELYNAQHLIAGIVTDAELDRPICKREKRVGSNRAETVCTTKRQMDEHKSELHRNMRATKTCDWSQGACG